VKRLLLLAVLGALVVGATGCDLSPPAATVNGVTISQSALNAQLASEVTDSESECAALVEAGETTSPFGVGTEGGGTTPNAVTPAFADNALETLVLGQLEKQELAARGVAVSAADVTAASSDYSDQLLTQLGQEQQENAAPTGCTLSTSRALSTQLPRGFLEREISSLAEQEIFEVAVGHVNVSEGALESYYRSHRAQVTQACLNVVLATSLANAQTLHDEIAAGTSFATASTSPAADAAAGPTGGELECEYPATVTDQFGATNGPTVVALKTGQLAAPLTLSEETSTGTTTTLYAVVQMRAHQLVPFATLSSSIRQAILSAHVAVVGTTLNRLVRRAHVTVDPRYGTWSPEHGVTVPTPPSPAFVLNAAADVPVTPLLSTGGLTIHPTPG
jgi:hypothetical protein